MNALLSRFPPKDEILKLFWVILAATNFLAFLGFAEQVSGYILRYTFNDIIVIYAYVQCYLLLEVAFTLFLFIFAGLILPKKWLRDHFSSIGSISYVVLTVFLYPWIGYTSGQGLNNYYILSNLIGKNYLIYFLWFLALILCAFLLIRIFKLNSNLIRLNMILERIGILGKVYAIIHLVSIFIIAWRLLS